MRTIIALRRLVDVLLLSALMLLVLIVVRAWAVDTFDPWRIDYNRPGVDITSEGPDDDGILPWEDWR